MTTMANLISKRVAKSARNLPRQLSGRSPSRVSARIEAATALEEWEAEGGASAGAPQASEHGEPKPSRLSWAPSKTRRRILHHKNRGSG